MKLDSEEQRAVLLEILAKTQFMGQSIDVLYQLKQAIVNAGLDKDVKREA